MYFVVNLKNGHIDFLKDIISISMNDLYVINFKSNNNVGYGYDIENILFFRQITENEYFRFIKN